MSHSGWIDVSVPGWTEADSARLRERMARHVDSGQVPGLLALVARGGETHVEVLGRPSFDDDRVLQRDAIFRIASLTKPIVAAGAMVLVDEGVLGLDDPIDDLLPELANRQVLRRADGPLDDTVPATRPITLLDLLTFRLGFGVVLAAPGSTPIQRAADELELRTLGPPWPPHAMSPDEWIRRFATLPLLHQPGEHWMYNTGSQVLGVLLERASGQSLEHFLRDRLFEPLGMVDTGFSVPADQRHRLTTAYHADPITGATVVLDPADEQSWWAEPPAMANAAGGLVSTIDDYWSFVHLLVDDGVHDDRRLLSTDAVTRMCSDHLTADQRAASTLFLGDDSGWGFGMAVPAAGPRRADRRYGFGWDGGTGTAWRTDAANDLTGILFTQVAMASPQPPAVFTDFWDALYDAT